MYGDSWGGIPAFSILINGAVPADDVATVKMQFRKNEFDRVILDQLDNTDGITIVSASGWTFAIPKRNLSLPQGKCSWWIKFWDVNGIAQTYLAGDMEVLQQGVLNA